METEKRPTPDRPVQLLPPNSELHRSKVEVDTKISATNGHLEGPSHTDLMSPQFLNVHKVPDSLSKGLTDSLTGELLGHGVVDLEATDFSQQSVVGTQYYDDLLAQDLTEDDRRLAAALVAVQLVQHQKNNQTNSTPPGQQQTSVLPNDLLNSKALSSISPIDKPAISAMVSSYIQAVEDETVQQQFNLLEQSNNDRSLKMYHSPQVSAQPTEVKIETKTEIEPCDDNRSITQENRGKNGADSIVSPNTSMDMDNINENDKDNSNNTGTSEEGYQMQLSDDLSGTLDEFDSDYEGESRPSRKSLPHKKRIPRKLKRATTLTPTRNLHMKGLKCNKCGEQFTNQSALVAHRATHSNKKTFACELCSKPFLNQLKFFEHLKSHYEPLITISTNPSNFPLPSGSSKGSGSSSAKTAEPASLNNEVAVSSTSSSIPMDVTQTQIDDQTEQNVNQNTFESTISESTSSELPPNDQLKMEQVNLAPSKDGVTLGNVITSAPLACMQCGKQFRRPKALETHIAISHTKHEDMEEFSEPEDMMEGIRHVVNMVQEVDEKPASTRNWKYNDNLSNTGNSTNARSSSSIKSESNDADSTDNGMGLDPMDSPGEKKKTGKQLPCPHCPRTFNHRNSLMYHVRSHSGQRPHQCEICGKSFFAASALKVHLRLHSGAKPYKCEFCERHFRQWGDLKYHITSIHSDQKQFQCEYCGKDFARKYSLIVHRRIHTGEKNYVCEFCHKSFRASSYLQNHRRIHTGEKPHQCQICGKPFRVRSDMKRHTATHNKVMVATSQLQNNDVNQRLNLIPNDHHTGTIARVQDGTITLTKVETDHSDNEFKDMKGSQLLVRFEEEAESILPDGAACATPLNLNIRPHSDSDDGLAYSRDTLERESSTLYVWIPAGADHLLPDE